MSVSYEKECDSKRIECVRVYQPKLSVGGGSSSSAASSAGGAAQQNPGTAAKPAGGGKKKKKAGYKVRLYNVVFLLAYVFQIGYVVRTIGEPYRLFLEKADREGFQGK